MSLPDQTPKLPKLPFLIGDVLLLAVAGYIIAQSEKPLTTGEITAVVICVALGAIVVAVPFLTDYARKQDEALDERQRGLEALSQTINSAAEQISIAASGLHQITEIAHKNLKHAEQLPHKLQEKISEFNAQLDNAREDDREELEKELAELRASESDRLASSAERIHKAVAELAKLDASFQQHASTRPAGSPPSAPDNGRLEAKITAAFDDAISRASRDLTATQARAFAEFEARLNERTATLFARFESAVTSAASLPPHTPAPATVPPSTEPTDITSVSPASAEVAAPPRRPRKARREEPAPTTPQPTESLSATTSSVEPEPTPEPASIAPTEEPVAPPTPTPPAPPAEAAHIIEPIAPASADPFPPAVEQTASEPAQSVASPAPAPKKRVARKAERDITADLPLELDEPVAQSSHSDDSTGADELNSESVLSSDGATRLIATAYIGIGNRLFIRGEGPGLRWDKGVPLQFISIGKWRWETIDASAPVRFKLYKNDEVECAALGELAIDPGHQHEVTARF